MKLFRTFPGILIAAVLIPQLAIIPLIFTGILFFVEDSLKSQFVDNARNTANILSGNFSHLHTDQLNQSIQTQLQEYIFTGHISHAEIILNDGNKITTEGSEQQETRPFKEDFLFGQHEDNIYFISVPLIDHTGEQTGVIHLGFDESPINKQLETSFNRTFYSATALILISTFFIVIAAGYLSRPLRRIRDAARKISFQKEDATLETNSTISELSSLGKSLESMRQTFVDQHKQIKSRENYISSIMRNMADPLVISNGSLQIQTLNNAARKMFQYEKEEYRSQGVDILFDHDLINKILSQARNKELICLEGSGHNKAGDTIPLELNISHITFDTSELYIINARDIRVRKQVEQALLEAKKHAEESNKQKSYFLSTMSHELRTPMNAIIGYSDLILEDIDKDDHNRSDLLRIKKAAKHLLDLINSILDLSRIEAGKMELHITHFSINDLLDEAISTTHQLVKNNNNKLTVDTENCCETLNSDYLKLKQIVINILGNAAKFTENGEILVRIFNKKLNDHKLLCIEIRDTGIGIETDRLTNLFESFTQADSSVSRKYGGTGLGLAISKKLAELLDGNIEVESSPEKGTTFLICVSTELGESTSVFI